MNGINYLTEVRHWGNANDGPGFGKQEIRKNGPDGYLSKFHKTTTPELEKLDYVCEGDDTTRCPWPMGIASKHMPMCETGFKYSYSHKKCFILSPSTPKCSPDTNSNMLELLFARQLN